MENVFRFKKFSIQHHPEVMKVGTDGVLVGTLVNCENSKNILDIGTGTGLIALMLAQRSDANIYSIDINPKAVEIARKNVNNSPWKERIKVENISLQAFNSQKKFDCIVSNPPFFSEDVKPTASSRKQARHNDDLKVEELLHYSEKLLEEVGQISVIYPIKQSQIFLDIAGKNGFYCKRIVEIYPNFNSDCVRRFITVSKISSEVITEKLVIENGKRHDYTEEYINLTRDFYLAF
ncbi:MAG TPA: methyltransferase [Bacteroidales bacterium]|jgi:tRNA1Val (adenine37-N6)-methyltransferase|nr:methyltransferase [Bacteroidales bacterium]HOL97172.1 methyltransferase [Bacteroidales bacterium]HOM35464.1 methyltransferase [Bacteroidales bacterium]HPD23045.1 methyltransferase [Bacteroidales bacterium]HRS99333.1 methyltransferase [Bacteroidales bacterium]